MKVKVVDQLHVSAVGPDTFGKGQEIEVSAAMGKDLIKRGLVTAVEGDEGDEGEKAEAAPQNKMDAAPVNKADAPHARKRGPRRE